MGTSPAGWYADPQPGSTGVRYWDGSQWTGQIAPAAPVAPPPVTGGWQPPPAFGINATPTTKSPVRLGTWLTVLLVVVSLVLVALVGFGLTVSSDNGHASAGPVATVAPDTTIAEPQYIPVYHPKLDTNGDPELVPFTAARSTEPTASVPRALFAVPAGSDVVDPATAHTVVQTLWEVRRDAISDENRRLLQQFETGSALAIDAERGCNCGAGDHFGAATGISVSVPHQHAFPAWFFAELRTTFNRSPWGASLVFTRASRTDPWRLAFAGGGAPVETSGAVFPLAVDADGFASAATVQNPPVAAILADYWQRVKDDGTTQLPASLAPAPQTDEWAGKLVENRQGDVNSGNNLIMYYRFYADRTTGTWIVPLAGGTALQCTTIQEQKTYLPGRNEVIKQPDSRTNWGVDIPPGEYGAMITVADYTPCFEFRPGTAYFQANGVTPADVIASIPRP